MTTTEGTIYGYARVSTQQQDLTLQIESLLKAGIEHKNIYTDKQTGKNMDRESLNELLKKVRPGDIILVKKLDRLGRSVSQVIALLEKLYERDIYVKSIDDGVDTSNNSPMAQAMVHLLAMFAEMERRFIKERTEPAIARARAEGRQFGRTESNKGLYERALEEFLSPENKKTFKTIQEEYGKDDNGKWFLSQTTFFRRVAERRAVEAYLEGKFPSEIEAVEDTKENQREVYDAESGKSIWVDNQELGDFRLFLKNEYMGLTPKRFHRVLKEFKKNK
ncbi:recombinase family protein [Priestia megaterium]|uniref:recombinase family protein n=1 Tax=Priestia megaterium TaxID=1404 RepID=UPI00285DC411|nr:recombinase family protein [Priestia megaterium]MDR7207649.1 DNA invertase Pin-like site-specific DNA recombinase [Priestia megaterium]